MDLICLHPLMTAYHTVRPCCFERDNFVAISQHASVESTGVILDPLSRRDPLLHVLSFGS